MMPKVIIQLDKKIYDKFLHIIQQQKMKELWDNKADEAWQKQFSGLKP
jgi:hypothetical protein